MLIRTLLIAALSIGQISFSSAQQYEANWESLNKRAIPQWFKDAKFGIFIHWGLYSVPSYCPPGPDGYSEWYWETLNKPSRANHPLTKAFHNRVYGENFKYPDFRPMFKAELFDPEHWAQVFKKSGAKYIVPTSKHHDGYAIWPSKEASLSYGTPWNSFESGPKRDLLGELAGSVKKAGLEFGIYYSLLEWNNPYWKEKQKYVDEVMIPQIKDVVTKYEPRLIFADGEWVGTSAFWKSPEILAWLYNESPVKDKIVVNDRWGKGDKGKNPSSYYTSEYGAGLDGSQPWEENRGIGESFGYNRAETAEHYKTSNELIVILADVVSRGGNLLLDIGPTADGRIPELQEARLLDMGKWLDVNGEAIYGTTMWKTAKQWSAGTMPTFKKGNYQSDYNINNLVKVKTDGTAYIQAFFTQKGSSLYAIVPHLSAKGFIINDLNNKKVSKVEMLGFGGKLKWKQSKNSLDIEAPSGLEMTDASGVKCFKIAVE